MGSIPGLGCSPGEGNHSPLQYFCLGNPMDTRAWQAIYSPRGCKRVEYDLVTKQQQHNHNSDSWQTEKMRLGVVCEDLLKACSCVSFCLCSAPLLEPTPTRLPPSPLPSHAQAQGGWPYGLVTRDSQGAICWHQCSGWGNGIQPRGGAELCPKHPASLSRKNSCSGHLITPRRKLFQLKYRVLEKTLSARQPQGPAGG